jgi:hypothetical protein
MTPNNTLQRHVGRHKMEVADDNGAMEFLADSEVRLCGTDGPAYSAAFRHCFRLLVDT